MCEFRLLAILADRLVGHPDLVRRCPIGRLVDTQPNAGQSKRSSQIRLNPLRSIITRVPGAWPSEVKRFFGTDICSPGRTCAYADPGLAKRPGFEWSKVHGCAMLLPPGVPLVAELLARRLVSWSDSRSTGARQTAEQCLCVPRMSPG